MGVEHLLAKWTPGQGPIVNSPDALFVLDPVSEAQVLSEGGRLADEYSRYFAPETARAPLVPGPFGRLGVGQTSGAGRPGLVYPLEGVLPSDEFTLSFWVRPVGPVAGETILVQAARVLNVTYDGAVLNVVLKEWGAQAAVETTLPPDEWTAVTVVWRDPALSVFIGDQRVADAASETDGPRMPASWCDGGLLLLPGAVNEPSIELAEVVIQRWARTPDEHLLCHGPTIAVDAAAPTGTDWSPWLGGSLALYTGMRVWQDGVDPDVGTSVRDQQFERCADAGLPVVRISGAVTATRVRDGELDFTWLDDKLRVWAERGVAVHLTLDYNHPLTGGGGEGDWDSIRLVPDDPERYAELCSAVLGHVRERVRVVSVALWNEPDIEDYWVGSLEQFFELWAAVQRRLAADHPDLPLGSGDFAHAETTQEFLRWAGERGLPVSAAYTHNYDQDFAAIAGRIRALRAAADEAGFADIPLRITEWGMHIMRQRELYFGPPTSVNRAWPNRFRTSAAAAYCLAFLAHVTEVDPLIDMGAFSSVGSVEPVLLTDSNVFVSDEAMLSSDDPPQPFPSFHAMTLLWKLGGPRVRATSNWPGLRMVATNDGGVVTVVFGSFRQWRGYEDTIPVAFDWAGLPERFTWRLWIVDEAHETGGGRLRVVDEGDESDLLHGCRIGALSAACIQLTPR